MKIAILLLIASQFSLAPFSNYFFLLFCNITAFLQDNVEERFKKQKTKLLPFLKFSLIFIFSRKIIKILLLLKERRGGKWFT